jgi:hypothetical protein
MRIGAATRSDRFESGYALLHELIDEACEGVLARGQ